MRGILSRRQNRLSASPRTNLPPEERQIGMVFQSYAIWPHMTVAENIGLVLTMVRRAFLKTRPGTDPACSPSGATR